MVTTTNSDSRCRKIQRKVQLKHKNIQIQLVTPMYQVQENGSLLFSAVEKQDEAEYRCKVPQIIFMPMMMAMIMTLMMLTLMTTLTMTISNEYFEGEEHVRGGPVSSCSAQGRGWSDHHCNVIIIVIIVKISLSLSYLSPSSTSLSIRSSLSLSSLSSSLS